MIESICGLCENLNKHTHDTTSVLHSAVWHKQQKVTDTQRPLCSFRDQTAVCVTVTKTLAQLFVL